jgi:hypothetical protein
LKSAKEWTKLIRDDVDLRLAKGEKPERVDDLIADWLAAIQADAAADMRERAAKECDASVEAVVESPVDDSADANVITKGMLEATARAIRALPLEEP